MLNLELSTSLSGGAALSVLCRPVDCSFSGRMPTLSVRDYSTPYLVDGRNVGVVQDLVARMNRYVVASNWTVDRRRKK